MLLTKFIIYTFIGSAFWSIVLLGLGYFLGEALALQNFYLFTLILIIICILVVGLYVFVRIKKY